jgi:hypothetical protein
MEYIEGRYPKAALAILREMAGVRLAEKSGYSECPTEELEALRRRMRELVTAAAEGGTMPRSQRSIAASNRRR